MVDTPFPMRAPSPDDILFGIRRDSRRTEIAQLRQELNRTLEETQKVKRQITEEKLALVIAAKFSDEIKDPTRHKAARMEDFQKKIFEQMMTATEARCVQEMVGYYRLAGRTTFTFQRRYTGVRLETFYGRTYKEPYYLLMRRDAVHSQKFSIEKHTIPYFIPIEELQKKFLPYDQETLLRILQDFLQAYISRREQVQELRRFAEGHSTVTVLSDYSAINKVEILLENDQQSLRISLYYDDIAFDYPTRVNITNTTANTDEPCDFSIQERIFCSCRLLEAFGRAFRTDTQPTAER